jgi:hypothetical protein
MVAQTDRIAKDALPMLVKKGGRAEQLRTI